MSEWINSLVYNFLNEQDPKLGEQFKKETNPPSLPDGSPSINEIYQFYKETSASMKRKSGNSTPRKGGRTPLRGILKTPTGKGGFRVKPETLASSRKRAKIAENVENDNEGLSNSDLDNEAENDKENDDSDSRPVLRGPPATPRTLARRGKGASDLNTSSLAEGYFDDHDTKVLTSDHTLSRLKTPRLSHGQLMDLVEGSDIRYEKEIRELVMDHQTQFPMWLSLLHRGFNIITYGLGSKKSLIQNFHSTFLADEDCIVVNGYFPSLTMKSVLTAISEDVLELGSSFSNLNDHVQGILDNVDEDIYLLIHNIDGATLRNEKSQSEIAQLAAHPLIHLICSIDHINAPLLWDQNKLSKLNFIWFDTTTFLPYREETRNETSLSI